MSEVRAEDVVAAARMRVYGRHPYLGAVLWQVRMVSKPGLRTLAVDGGWRLYYDPETVLAWYREEQVGKLDRLAGKKDAGHDGVAAVLFHEIGHLVRKHAERMLGMDAVCANAAQDREINDDVLQAGWGLPGQPLLPEDIGMARGLTAEEYYRHPEVGKVQPGCVLWAPGCGGACGGCANNPVEGEGDSAPGPGGGISGRSASGGADGPITTPPPVGPLEREIALRRAALATVAHARGRDSVPAGLMAWAKSHLRPPKVDWRRRLRGLARQALASVAGASDWTWRRPGRRSLHSAGRPGWPLSPSTHCPVPTVAVVLDTSGSMMAQIADSRTAEDEALSEVLGLVLAVGGQCWGYACDAAVHAEVRLTSARDIERLNRGGGGTLMTPGLEAARKRKPDVVVIITDGILGGEWPTPEDCRGLRVLAVVVGGSGEDCPAHIPCVEIDP
jgi:predicted metal-dependent peptidase